MKILVAILLTASLGVTGCRSHTTTDRSPRECEIVSFASQHGRAFYQVEDWRSVPISAVGRTTGEVKRKLGPPQPVGDAPPDDFGGFYLMHDTPEGLYRVHYSADWNKVTRAFKAVLKPEGTSEQSPGHVRK